MSHGAEPADLNHEQAILDSWAEWIEKELPERRASADRAYKRALQIGDEPAWQHAEIVERSYGQLEEMRSRQDPYFARIRGQMRDADGEPFEVDLRVHRYHRSEAFPVSSGGEMLDISHLAPLADLVRNPAQKELQLTLRDREFLDWLDRGGANPSVKVLDCTVEDIELEGGRVVRVAPRYGAIFEDRVRRRLGQSATPALDILADVLDQEQNAIIANRDPALQLVILDGPAGTGKTVVAAHRIAVAAPPESPGLYLTPTTTLRDYVRPVLPRLGLERARANAWSLVDLAAMMWPDFPWDDDMLGIVPESSATREEWTQAFETVRKRIPNASPERIYREAAPHLGRTVGRSFGLHDVAALLWLGAWSRRPRPKPEPDWVIIDEAQAVPILAYEAIREWLGPGVSWILAGDLMQQGSHHDWDGWSLIQQALGLSARRVAHLWLSRSYRVPPKIHAAAERLRLALNAEAKPSESVPWHLHAGQVTVTKAVTPEELVQDTRARLEAALDAGIVSIALLAPDIDRMAYWEQEMSRWGRDFQVLHGNAAYRGGVVLTTLDMVRGLEFDGVLILDANAAHYPNTPAAARSLYTSLTRSRRVADLLALDTHAMEPSPWLPVIEPGL
ncbi:MAG: AAA family ATPase [Firmicutes bacterium]|nr:AAA family ATPase [Bacillota bacterium]